MRTADVRLGVELAAPIHQHDFLTTHTAYANEMDNTTIPAAAVALLS